MSTGTDRWNQMILVLSGESVPPPPPALPGHVHRQPWRVPDDEREMRAAVIWWALAREVQGQP
jgi:hypothetical protein